MCENGKRQGSGGFEPKEAVLKAGLPAAVGLPAGGEKPRAKTAIPGEKSRGVSMKTFRCGVCGGCFDFSMEAVRCAPKLDTPMKEIGIEFFGVMGFQEIHICWICYLKALGVKPTDDPLKCPKCNGGGKIGNDNRRDCSGTTCPRCKGVGRIDINPGEGFLSVEEARRRDAAVMEEFEKKNKQIDINPAEAGSNGDMGIENFTKKLCDVMAEKLSMPEDYESAMDAEEIVERIMTMHWDIAACTCWICREGRKTGLACKDKYLPHKSNVKVGNVAVELKKEADISSVKRFVVGIVKSLQSENGRPMTAEVNCFGPDGSQKTVKGVVKKLHRDLLMAEIEVVE